MISFKISFVVSSSGSPENMSPFCVSRAERVSLLRYKLCNIFDRLDANYVLFGSWFSNPAQITEVKSKGMDVNAMVKKSSRK